MKKSFWVILAVIMTLLIIGSGVYITYAQNNPPQPPTPPTPLPTTPAFLRDPPTPIPPESLPPDELAIDYYFVNEGEILGMGMQLPRALTSQEKDTVIQIALNIEPVSVKVSQVNSPKTIPGTIPTASANTATPITNQWFTAIRSSYIGTGRVHLLSAALTQVFESLPPTL